MASTPSTLKSAPVLLPNAKKPTLLMRLFSTERKSSYYVMPTPASPADDSGDPFFDAGIDSACQQKRHTKRLQSVDSVMMRRDQEALLNERKQNQRHQSQRVRRSPDRGAKQPSADTVRPSSASTDVPRSTKQPLTKIEIRPKTVELTPTEASSPESTPRTPTPLSPLTPASPDLQQCAPKSQQSQRAVAQSPAKKSPEAGPMSKAHPLLPSAPPMTSEDSAPATVSKKRQSMSGESSTHAIRAVPQNQLQRQRPSKPAKSSKSRKGNRKLKHRKKKSPEHSGEIKVDTSKPLEFPTTPDIISEYHRQKPFLNHNEEWLIVELLEYECLIDGLEIIRTIAKHSKFFEAAWVVNVMGRLTLILAGARNQAKARITLHERQLRVTGSEYNNRCSVRLLRGQKH